MHDQNGCLCDNLLVIVGVKALWAGLFHRQDWKHILILAKRVIRNAKVQEAFQYC